MGSRAASLSAGKFEALLPSGDASALGRWSSARDLVATGGETDMGHAISWMTIGRISAVGLPAGRHP